MSSSPQSSVDTSPARPTEPALLADRVRAAVRDVPDFPKPGILFKDITPLLADAGLLRDVARDIAGRYVAERIDRVAAIESRGFIFGAAVALELGAGFVPVRKPGKLPYHSRRVEYALEYGTDCLEAHVDAFPAGARVLLLDDVLATGGTAAAAADLVGQLGGDVVAAAFVIELSFLNGRSKLPGLDVSALVTY